MSYFFLPSFLMPEDRSASPASPTLPYIAELLSVVETIPASCTGGSCTCCQERTVSPNNVNELFCSIDCIADYASSDDDNDYNDRMDEAYEAWLEYKLDEDYDW